MNWGQKSKNATLRDKLGQRYAYLLYYEYITITVRISTVLYFETMICLKQTCISTQIRGAPVFLLFSLVGQLTRCLTRHFYVYQIYAETHSMKFSTILANLKIRSFWIVIILVLTIPPIKLPESKFWLCHHVHRVKNPCPNFLFLRFMGNFWYSPKSSLEWVWLVPKTIQQILDV